LIGLRHDEIRDDEIQPRGLPVSGQRRPAGAFGILAGPLRRGDVAILDERLHICWIEDAKAAVALNAGPHDGHR
jgi:hypothetical protein